MGKTVDKKVAEKKETKPAAKAAAPKKAEVKAPAKKAEVAKKPEVKAPAKKAEVKAPAKATEAKAPAKKADAPKEADLKILPVPDACDAVADGFKTKGRVGFYDAESADCEECGKEFPKAMAACKHNTEVEAKMASEKKAKKSEKGVRGGGERTPLGGLVSSGAGKNELMMLSKAGASLEEMAKNRGAVSSHIAALKKKGFTIEHKDGRYYAKV